MLQIFTGPTLVATHIGPCLGLTGPTPVATKMIRRALPLSTLLLSGPIDVGANLTGPTLVATNMNIDDFATNMNIDDSTGPTLVATNPK